MKFKNWWDAMAVLYCLIFGHRWQRFGYPCKDDDTEKDDTQIFQCHRCWAMPRVKHNGMLPRFVLPIHWTKKENK